LVTEFF
jgi:hypothetical protein